MNTADQNQLGTGGGRYAHRLDSALFLEKSLSLSGLHAPGWLAGGEGGSNQPG